jgi:hypothetical protein
MTTAYLIFEVRLPLINNEQYELNRIIPIPQITRHSENSIAVTSDYLAANLRRDMIVPLDNLDVTSCTKFQENNLLCVINQPIYDIKEAKSLCEAQIINIGGLSACRARVSDCSDKWVRLHTRGAWLFSCCEECTARIFCSAGVTSRHLRGTGIITLDFGCMLKGKSFIIHSRNDYYSELKLTSMEEKIYTRESSINHILTDSQHTFVPEDHKKTLKELKTKIEQVKEQQQTLSVQSSTHDTHNYVLYTVVGVLTTVFIVWGTLQLRRTYRDCSATISGTHDPSGAELPHSARAASAHERRTDNDSVEMHMHIIDIFMINIRYFAS